MPLQPPQYVGNLDSTNPVGTDSRTIADDSIRNFKEGMRMSFASVTGPVTAAHGDLNLLAGFAAASRKLMTGQGGVTKSIFANPTAPTGWTIDATFSGDMLVTAGTVAGQTVTGGDRGGTDDPGIISKVASHTHTVVVPAHTHLMVDASANTSSSLTSSEAIAQSRDEDNFKDYSLAGNTPNTSADVGRTGPAQDEGTGVTAANTGAANGAPKYAGTIVCTLDA